jgi:hypothetical protein
VGADASLLHTIYEPPGARYTLVRECAMDGRCSERIRIAGLSFNACDDRHSSAHVFCALAFGGPNLAVEIEDCEFTGWPVGIAVEKGPGRIYLSNVRFVDCGCWAVESDPCSLGRMLCQSAYGDLPLQPTTDFRMVTGSPTVVSTKD